MFPGLGGRGGMNPRQLQAMMKQFGITMEDLDDVEEVVVRTAQKEYLIEEAEVTIMTAQGQRTWQVTGKVTARDRKPAAEPAAAAPPPPLFTDADVKLVAEQAGVSPEKARKALEASNGEPAEAIVKLLEEKN